MEKAQPTPTNYIDYLGESKSYSNLANTKYTAKTCIEKGLG